MDFDREELRSILDEEIGRLPEKYRRPVVLCYLEGKSHQQAASRLRCTEGSVRGRLDRAREKLKVRLTRRGLAPSAGLIASALAGDMASAAVPPSWVTGTVATLGRAATARAISGVASAAVLELADGVFRGMVLAKVKMAALVSASAVILAVGAVLLTTLPHSLARDRDAVSVVAQGVAAAAKDADAVTGWVLDQEGRPIAGARVSRGSDRARRHSPKRRPTPTAASRSRTSHRAS